MIGRTEECSALRDALARARSGFSAALVLRGEPGIGKTALLEYAIDQAREFQVLRVTGIESEMELGFAALHQLLQPLLPGLEDLPGPQRAALEAALGLASGPPPDRFLVALATLTLLSNAASRAPDGTGVLVAVDDAQWLDLVSAEALVFAARRLHADRVALVFTVREATDGPASFEGMDELRLRTLSAEDASELITTLVTGSVSRRVADQIAEQTGGNPLALVETVRELSAEQLAGAVMLPNPLPLGDDAQDRYWRKVSVLPPDQREFLLLAAADPSGDPELFERAAVSMGLDPGLARAPEVSELVTVADRVLFRHPLVRSAVYVGSPRRVRQRVHEALAAVSDPDRDSGRIAWHRAAAAAKPDEEIAALLETAADHVSQRGGLAAAAAFLRRAADLSPDEGHRGERLLAAAGAEFAVGRVGQATELLDQADPDLRDPRRRAEALRLRGTIYIALGDGYRAPATLLRAAAALAPFDLEASQETLLDAMRAEVYSGGREWICAYAGIRAAYQGDGAAYQDDCPAYQGDGAARASIPGLVLDGYSALLTDGPAKAGPFLRRALRAVLADDLSDDQRMRWYAGGIWCAVELFDYEAGRLLCDRFVALCRSRGALATLPFALELLATWHGVKGHLPAAAAANAEGREILTATGTPDRLGIRAVEILIPAWRGQKAALREAAEEMTRDCVSRGQPDGAMYADFAFAVSGIGTRDYASALKHARVHLNHNGPCSGASILPYVVEAAAGCGDWETAGLALSRLGARAAASGTDWALGLLARCRALVARSAGPDADAEREALFTESIEHLERAGVVTDLAWTRLLFGEWLRRKRRRRQAREHLLAAQETFQVVGADAFAERARLEAAATGPGGLSVPVRAGDVRKEEVKLTEREAQIARLVAGGATNAEAAAQLFISVSTVDYHLRNVYRKLDVSSRTMLSVYFRDRL